MTNPFSRRKTLFTALGLLLILLVFFLYWLLFRPPSESHLTKVINIKKGMPLRRISKVLEQEGIIKSAEFFTGVTVILGRNSEIKAGEYEFHTRMLPLEVLDALVKGQAKRHLITIPEGYTLLQIAQLLQESNIVKQEAFLQKTSSPVLISYLGLSQSAGPTLEGYLFPETYHLFKEMNPEEVIQMMVHQFKRVFGPELALKASRLGISERETIILASIIEKETPLFKEKPLVSAVFHNRLKRKIPLQSDPTVIYGIKNFDGNLTKEHLQIATPYNTYLLPGLPPTPICNPGKDSILAALEPAPVPYLYFVSKNDGSHYFSSDIEEHNQAVWKYQKYPKKNLLTNR